MNIKFVTPTANVNKKDEDEKLKCFKNNLSPDKSLKKNAY